MKKPISELSIQEQEKIRAYNRQKKQEERRKKKSESEDGVEEAVEKAKDLRFFGEMAYGKNASSSKEEIHIHRQFLRALAQSDVHDGETLRQLAKRTWDALLNADGLGISPWPDHLRDNYKSGYDVWIPMFDPKLQDFDGWNGYTVRCAMKQGWFEEHWTAPGDCTSDEPIAIDNLPALPLMKPKKESKQIMSEPKMIERSTPSTAQLLADGRAKLSSYLQGS